jgi:hypothetical protein
MKNLEPKCWYEGTSLTPESGYLPCAAMLRNSAVPGLSALLKNTQQMELAAKAQRI